MHHSNERMLDTPGSIAELLNRAESCVTESEFESEKTKKTRLKQLRAEARALEKELYGDHLGETGEYPQGQFGPHDEGGLRFAIGAKDGVVLMDFAKTVRSIGFDPDTAQSLGRLMMKKADAARKQQRGMMRAMKVS